MKPEALTFRKPWVQDWFFYRTVRWPWTKHRTSLTHFLMAQSLQTQKEFISSLLCGQPWGYKHSWATVTYSPTCRQLHIYRLFFLMACNWPLTPVTFSSNTRLAVFIPQSFNIAILFATMAHDINYSWDDSDFDWTHAWRQETYTSHHTASEQGLLNVEN